jgi:hypothetical protein
VGEIVWRHINGKILQTGGKMKKILLAICITFLFAGTIHAAASCVHYDKEIVCAGDSKWHLMEVFGEPLSRECIGVVRNQHRDAVVKMYEWAYHYRGGIIVFTIVGDKVTKIRKPR